MKKDPETTNLYMPPSWWGEVIGNLDNKIRLIAENYGFGSITFEATVAKGKVKDVVFKDKVRVRQKPKENLTQPPKR